MYLTVAVIRHLALTRFLFVSLSRKITVISGGKGDARLARTPSLGDSCKMQSTRICLATPLRGCSGHLSRWGYVSNRALAAASHSPSLFPPSHFPRPALRARRDYQARNISSTPLQLDAEQEPRPTMTSFYELKAELPGGKTYDFEQLKGKVVLIVNVASKWYVSQL